MSGNGETHKIIKHHVLWALGAGLMPIPIFDIAAVTAIQIDMLRQLANHYNFEYSQSAGKAFVTALTGGTLAKIGASLVKAVPGVGTVVGGVSMSAMSGASTYAVGQVANHYFSSGINSLNVDIEEAKKMYSEEYEKGKQVAAEFEKEEKSKGEKYKTAAETIGNLEKLKQSGAISEADFENMKQKILEGL
ncbi:MAG: DUF697 domain-containing protein [Dehalococcoidales bacterium]|nr:MAG: DUF697 domain-containing protein [Dehalococcoidales bacterium]